MAAALRMALPTGLSITWRTPFSTTTSMVWSTPPLPMRMACSAPPTLTATPPSTVSRSPCLPTAGRLMALAMRYPPRAWATTRMARQWARHRPARPAVAQPTTPLTTTCWPSGMPTTAQPRASAMAGAPPGVWHHPTGLPRHFGQPRPQATAMRRLTWIWAPCLAVRTRALSAITPFKSSARPSPAPPMTQRPACWASPAPVSCATWALPTTLMSANSASAAKAATPAR